MFSFMLLLYALVVVALLIQFKKYGHSPSKEVCADTLLTEESNTTPDESAGLQPV